MGKVCIWLGPAVVCLQIYCWSPAIYIPNERQNHRTPPKRAKPKIGQDGFSERMGNFGKAKKLGS